ncbi:hypothetical protein [Pedosphaera parvula]|nr:hypothetical protein [Pedosphaera parvula]
MKQFKLCLVAIFLVISTGVAMARAVRTWTYQELLDKADLVAIATPTATDDTKEHINLPGFDGQRVIGVETKFKVAAVLKGDKALKDFVLHYYRPGPDGMVVDNGPTFISFPISKKPTDRTRTYILFLLREADGRYASVVGQSDPGLGIRELEGVYSSAVVETQTKLGIDVGNVLRECQTIKPGMTRAELSKVFSTEEGGLSTAKHRTYVFHDCPYVKVDVDFNLSDPKQDVLDERPTDTIAKISKPYLEWGVND